MKIAVVGGANADIVGVPSEKLIMYDSNPGAVKVVPGGVGRNIACSLRALGAEVELVTAFGGDVYAELIKKDCGEKGIGLSLSKTLPGRGSSVYLLVTDEKGEPQVAVNDMQIVDEISPEYLSGIIGEINACDACVIDANLSRASLEYLAENISAPLYGDPVSMPKSVKLKGLLRKFRALKPNLMEYEALGRSRDCLMFVSLGAEGMLAVSDEEEIKVPTVRHEHFMANGAGDAATAAMVFADLSGKTMEETAQFAVAFASGKR